MKLTFWTWGLGLALVALPTVGYCDPNSTNSVQGTPDTGSAETNSVVATNVPPPEVTQQQIESATGRVVSAPAPNTSAANLTGPASEIARLAQAGVDESVMQSYITNSRNTFNLNSDAIIYLNDIGVPGTVVTAMIQHDQAMKAAAPPPVYSNPNPPPSETATPAPETTQPPTTEAPPATETPSTDVPPEAGGSTSYFYGSLAPYGSWIYVNGYGMCWQPTVVVGNPGWRPYCDGGYWAYTDCGWYWASTYSWGWAPFHYGRWFHHNHWGWCWAPDTVWGPSWVCWRYNNSHCGWAPLPPSACFTPGIGFTYYGHNVGFGFSFGLGASDFSFVGIASVSSHHLNQQLVAQQDVRGFFHNTTIARGVLDPQRNFVNSGLPASHFTAVTHTPLRAVQVRGVSTLADGHVDRLDADGRHLNSYRPDFPTPKKPLATRYIAQSPSGNHFSAGGAGLPSQSMPSRQLPWSGSTIHPIGPDKQPLEAASQRTVPTYPHQVSTWNDRSVPGHNMSARTPVTLQNNQATLTRPVVTQNAPFVFQRPTGMAQNNSHAIFNDSSLSGDPVLRSGSPQKPTAPAKAPANVYRQQAYQPTTTYVPAQTPAPAPQREPGHVWSTPATAAPAPVPAQPRLQPYYWSQPAPERSLPSVRQAPSVAAPRMESHAAPAPAPSAPSVSQGQGGSPGFGVSTGRGGH